MRTTLKISILKSQITFLSSNDTTIEFDNSTKFILFLVSLSTVHIVDVLVVDSSHPSWTCSSRVRVAVEDVNDNPPTFTVANETITLTEDAAVDMIIARLQVFDLDLGECSKLIRRLYSSKYW